MQVSIGIDIIQASDHKQREWCGRHGCSYYAAHLVFVQGKLAPPYIPTILLSGQTSSTRIRNYILQGLWSVVP